MPIWSSSLLHLQSIFTLLVNHAMFLVHCPVCISPPNRIYRMQARQQMWSWRIKFVTGLLIGWSPTPEAAHSTTIARPPHGTGGRETSRNVRTPGCSTLRTGSVNTTRWWTVGTENCHLEDVSKCKYTVWYFWQCYISRTIILPVNL